MEEVVTNLRSCLISSKGGVKLECLKKDYNVIVGESLPYKRFGYSSLEAFIRDISDVTVTQKNGELYVEATPSKSSAHITKLISRQVSRQRTRRKQSQTKKWNTWSTSRNRISGFKNNGPPPTRNGTQKSMNSFSKSMPGRSNLYTDCNRPTPLMETIVQCPMPQNNERQKSVFDIPFVPPNTRLKDKVTSSNVSKVNQSLNNSKINEELKGDVLIKKTIPPTTSDKKPKTTEHKPLKLSDRLKMITEQLSTNNNDIYSLFASNTSKSDDPRKELEIRANILHLVSPSYKMYTQKEKTDPTKVTIYASVKVGERTFYTYPEDAKSKEEAEKIAARLALVTIAKESSNPEVTTNDKKLIKERILSIITTHHNGVFMHQLPAYYSECYKETLPYDWRSIIGKCSEITQEKGAGNSTILSRSNPIAKQSDVSLSSNISYEFGSFSKDKIQLNPIGPAAPAKLKILEENTSWNVYTTCVISTVEVWVRLVGDNYNDNFLEMQNEMNDYYYNITKESMLSSTCVLGDFYAVLEEDNCWHRVQCINFESDTGIATMFFIDGGYEDQYKFDILHPLEKRFCSLPAQAVRVSLQGLEEFRECTQAITQIENHLMDQVFQMKVHRKDVDEDGSFATVTFYDINEKDNVDVNTVLFDKILRNLNATPEVQAGKLIELYVMHINVNGKIYAQLNSPARGCLQNLLNNETMLQINVIKNPLVKIDFTEMYLTQLNSQWYRAKVTDIQNDFEVTVFLVDIGQTITTFRGNLFQLDKISKVLQHILPQATQIFLHDIDESMYNERLVVKFNKLVSNTDLLLAKIVRVTKSGIPVVVIFKRLESDNMLASINSTLAYEEEVMKSNEDGNNNIKPKKRSERKNSHIFECGKLNPPTIPNNKYFDVHVSLAAHPGHFIVQPLESRASLEKMMLELQKCCNAYEESPLESINEGKLYAGKSSDNYWYRVYVTHVISDNMVSVYFCDFGNVTVVQRNSLQPLKSEFMELPYQAVKAKLIGVEPIDADWTVDDCLRFQDLVIRKNFVSIVAESVSDNFTPANGTVLGLKLIDTSTEEDIFIDKLLVKEQRAKLIEGERSSV